MNKYITPEMIRNILLERVDSIKKKVDKINIDAVSLFYSVPSGTYERTDSFYELGKKPEVNETKTGYEIIYTYKASDVVVNPWEGYPGSSDWAFDADFVNGFHGGPRKGIGGKWTWSPVASTIPSPWQYIYEAVNNL